LSHSWIPEEERKPKKLIVEFSDGSQEEFSVFAGLFSNPGEVIRVYYKFPVPAMPLILELLGRLKEGIEWELRWRNSGGIAG